MDNIRSALHELQLEAQRAKRLEANLDEKLISRSDDGQIVTATVSGTGRLRNLQLTDAALTHPARLGSLATLAIKRARSASAKLREAARAKYLPNVGSTPSVEAAFSSELESGSFEMEEVNGSWREHDEIAQNIEAYNKMVDANKYFKQHRLRQEIGNGAGVVVVGVDGVFQSIELQSDAPRQVGLKRLSEQIVEAIYRAEGAASKMRKKKLGEISINGVSIGERL